MSGIHQMFVSAGSGAGPVANLNGTIGAAGSPPLSANVQYATNGTISGAGYTGGPTNWYSPTTTSIGNSYWIRFTLQSGAAWNTGLVSGTIYALSTARGITYTVNTAIALNAEVSVAIYSDSGGTNLVGGGLLDVSVDGSG